MVELDAVWPSCGGLVKEEEMGLSWVRADVAQCWAQGRDGAKHLLM